jgi:LAO/AO transport system kinase
MVEKYVEYTKANGFFEYKRNDQAKYWMYETINEQLKAHFYQDEEIQKLLPEIENKILSNELTSFVAAKKLLEKYFEKINKNN